MGGLFKSFFLLKIHKYQIHLNTQSENYYIVQKICIRGIICKINFKDYLAKNERKLKFLKLMYIFGFSQILLKLL